LFVRADGNNFAARHGNRFSLRLRLADGSNAGVDDNQISRRFLSF
jgi:hypothetical protein